MFTPEQNQQIKAIQIIAAALMLGILFFIAMALVVINFAGFQTDTVLFLPLLIISIAMMANIPLGFVLYNKRMPALNDATSFEEKMGIFRSAFIIRAALFESSSFMAIVSFLLTGKFELLIIAFAGLAAMLITFPTKTKIQDIFDNTYQL
jgi:hypothetical protein